MTNKLIIYRLATFIRRSVLSSPLRGLIDATPLCSRIVLITPPAKNIMQSREYGEQIIPRPYGATRFCAVRVPDAFTI